MTAQEPHRSKYNRGERVRDIYTCEIHTVSGSYWQWYAGGDTSDYTVEFTDGSWNKSQNLILVP